MVRLTRFSREEYYLNPFLIETVESTPDTVITLTSGKKLLVKESAEEVVARVTDYFRSLSLPSFPSRIESTKREDEE
ncbi:conserved hypothetical protein [[Clostridium] ultunense Esp]|uniref:flagellar FlbD family protein n=1 Tax=Thermicanus aegyptius TaxID=94009 RepID=UPI0002B70BF3|nr:flagellar FlbD family protein [Thermicanus aegyptius]CCQ97775.1 conserved hypothetical protein [[Clostridium] ultunense Esp]